MVGRVAGEQTYYYNVSTGETRYDKPEEFMLEDELREHHNFLKFQLAAETHAKRVGELQVEVPRGCNTKRTRPCTTCQQGQNERSRRVGRAQAVAHGGSEQAGLHGQVREAPGQPSRLLEGAARS